jgi:ATP-dependent helicase/nuclease subunit A
MTALTLPFEHDDDAWARETIRCDLDRSLFVEAGAGTGKTTVLVSRIVELVASGRLTEPGALVAITFTEAAAAELRDRVRCALEEAAADTAASRTRRQRCELAVRRIDEAVITTIHGFANRILAEHPLQAGLPPGYEVVDEVAATVAFDQRWARFVDELFDDPSAEGALVTAFTLGLRSEQLRAIADHFHARWDRLVDASFGSPTCGPPAVDVERVRAPLREAVAHLAGRDDVDDRLVDRLRAAAESLATLEGVPDDLTGLEALDAAWVPTASNLGSAAVWGDAKPVVAALLDQAARARFDELSQARRGAFESLLEHVRRFVLRWAGERRQAGQLEFHDLLVLARDLLRDNDRVRTTVASRLGALFIDEFQDTDPIQLELAFLLAPPEREPGKLLVVGDPKQSIYRFRGADIGLWDAVRHRFEGTVRLTRNFRSVPTLLTWVNAVFARLIGEGRPGAQPPYVPLAAVRAGIRDDPAAVLVGGAHELPVGEVRRVEAAELARLIVSMRTERWEVGDERASGGRRPLRYADVALLVPTRTPLGQLERALDDADVPYRVESRSLVWSTDVVRELLAILAAIDDPSDEVAVVAALRSPGFACSDVDLVDFRSAGGRWDYTQSPPDELAPDQPVVAAGAALRAFHEARYALPVDVLVERVIRERRLVELTAVQRRPRDHRRRLRFVLDSARAFVESGGDSLGGFVAWATLQHDERAQVVEAVVPEADDDAVRVLTVHGSKGLEFPVVVLAGLNAAPDNQPPAVVWGERPEVAIGRQATPRFETAGFSAALGEARDADELEARRLLYVATTRARDHLVVSLHHKRVAKGRPSHAQHLHEVAGELAGLWRPGPPADQLVLVPPPAARVGDPPPDDVLSIEARAAWLERHDELLQRVVRPTTVAATAVATVAAPDVDDTDPSSPSLVERRRRGGSAVGRAVHGVLQDVDLDGPDDAAALAPLAAFHAGGEGIPDAAELVARLASSALRSPTVTAARRSPRRWRELYVAAPVGAGVELVEGYVDLLYEDDAGDVVVVDYKTDAGADAIGDAYRVQGASYALAVGTALGRPVARCVFVFCRADEPAVERTIDDLDAAVADVRRRFGGRP